MAHRNSREGEESLLIPPPQEEDARASSRMSPSWGIFNDKVPKGNREAYDIRQIIDAALARSGMLMGVEGRQYLASNPEHPPAEIIGVGDER